MTFSARILEQHYSEPALFEAAAGEWRSTTVYDYPNRPSVGHKPDTISNTQKISVPKIPKVFKPGKCSALDKNERQWLGKRVKCLAGMGTVWSLAPAGDVWVVLEDATVPRESVPLGGGVPFYRTGLDAIVLV